MTSNPFDLQGRKALVTGSSRGIGRAIALILAQHGADVMIHYAGNHAAAEEVAGEIKNMGRQAPVVGADLYESDAPQKLAEAVKQHFGHVDILVLNASVQYRRQWNEEPSRDEIDRQVVVNLRSVYELMQLLAPAMIAQKWGRILTIGSIQQYRPSKDMPIYAALKGGLENLARNMARQLAGHGITVNNLAPGVIETDRNAHITKDPQIRQRVMKWVPLGRLGEPEDCAPAALLLCSEAGSYITGIDLPVDGGMKFT